MQLALSLSILANAVANLAYGPLSDRFGRRPVLLVGLAAFIAGSLACALAPSIELLIGARVVQSIGGAAGMVLARAIVRDLYDRERSASIIAYLTMAMVVAPMLAPTIGAVLLDVASWRAIFVLATGIGVALSWPIVVTLAETRAAGSAPHRRSRSPARAPCCAPASSGPTCCRARLASRMFFAFIAGAPYFMMNVLGRLGDRVRSLVHPGLGGVHGRQSGLRALLCAHRSRSHGARRRAARARPAPDWRSRCCSAAPGRRLRCSAR